MTDSRWTDRHMFVLAWGLRTFRVAGILTSPLCWWLGWLLWHLHPACHLARAAKEVYDGPDSKNHHASSMNLDFSSFLRCISTGEYDFLDYESGEVSSTKCSSEPLYAPKMIYDLKNRRIFKGQVRWDEQTWKEMKRQFKKQLKWDVQMPTYVKQLNRWKDSRFFCWYAWNRCIVFLDPHWSLDQASAGSSKKSQAWTTHKAHG